MYEAALGVLETEHYTVSDAPWAGWSQCRGGRRAGTVAWCWTVRCSTPSECAHGVH